jgi:hypothetical protein
MMRDLKDDKVLNSADLCCYSTIWEIVVVTTQVTAVYLITKHSTSFGALSTFQGGLPERSYWGEPTDVCTAFPPWHWGTRVWYWFLCCMVSGANRGSTDHIFHGKCALQPTLVHQHGRSVLNQQRQRVATPSHGARHCLDQPLTSTDRWVAVHRGSRCWWSMWMILYRLLWRTDKASYCILGWIRPPCMSTMVSSQCQQWMMLWGQKTPTQKGSWRKGTYNGILS